MKDKLVEQKIDINCRYRFSGWVFNPTLRTVMNNQNESIHLGVKERDLLCILITRRRPISKAEFLKLIYEKDFSYEDNSVNALIYRLRKKLKTILSNEQELILSAYADGYELSEMPTKEELDEM